MALIRGGISVYLANALLNKFWNGVAYTFPTTVYAAINKSRWSPISYTEPSGGSYARVPLAIAPGLFSTPANGSIANAGAITFPTATADWCPATAQAYGLVFLDAPTGGNVLWGVDRAGGPRTILSGGPPVVIAPGAAAFQFTGF